MAIEWILFQIFINTVEVSALFYLLCSKFAAKSRNFVPAFAFILGITIFISLPIWISFRELPLTEIVMPSFSLIYLIFFRDGSILKKIFWVFISCALILAIAFFCIAIITLLRGVTHEDIITITSTERLLAMVIAKTLQVVSFYLLAKKKQGNEVRNVLSSVPILICLAIPLVSLAIMICMHILVIGGVFVPESVTFLISVGFLFINVIVFILYEFINREAEKNYVLIARNKQYDLTEQHNKEVVEMYEKMREWRHDHRHHMQLILSILEKSDYNNSVHEAVNYIKNMDENIKSSSLEIITGNIIIDAIVSAKAALASVYGITFTYNISLKDDIIIDNTDLCSILSNLFDNAIEACYKLDENRYINLKMVTFRNQFSIEITNSTDGKYKIEKGIFKTTKRGDLHGIGIGHIKSVVENYGGIYDITPESDTFTANITIPLTYSP